MNQRRILLGAAVAGVAGLSCVVGSSTSTEGRDGGPSGTGGSAVNTGGMTGTSGTGGSAGATGSGGAGAGAGGARGTGGAAGTGGVTGATGGVGSGGTGAGGRPGTGGAGTTGSGGAGTTGSGGAGGADPCGASNPARVPLPMIGAGMFNVTTYGAVGDGTTDNTQMLQAALSAAGAAGGGTVAVPSGTFLSGPIVISSGTRLELAAGAVLKLLPRASYPAVATAFITTTGNAHDIALSGAGTIEGQGQAWWDAFAADSTVARPQEVSLSHVTRLEISGLRFQNSPVEHIWVKQDTNVTITGITISTLAVAGKNPPKNTDGVDITATGVFFCNNNITTGDDNVVMGGTGIYVAYSTLGVGHGCTIGSITQNGDSDVTVDHVTFNGTTAGVRMKAARDRGGLVQNLTYTNLTMTNVQTPITIVSYYPTLPTDPTVDTAMPITATTPIWQNITIKNLIATGATNAGDLWGLPESKISNVVLDNVKIQAATGIRIFHAAGISFINGSTVTPRSGAVATVFDAAVSGITTTAF